MKLYDSLATIEVHCDASQLDLGVILQQKDEQAWMLIPDIKRRFGESHYHSTKLEKLAAIWSKSLKRKKIQVITDYVAIIWTLSKKNIIPRIIIWC